MYLNKTSWQWEHVTEKSRNSRQKKRNRKKGYYTPKNPYPVTNIFNFALKASPAAIQNLKLDPTEIFYIQILTTLIFVLFYIA